MSESIVTPETAPEKVIREQQQIVDSLEALARRSRVLDLGLYGAMYLASRSVPGDGWEATLWPLWEFASDLHDDLNQLAVKAHKPSADAGAVA